ncbi:MAG: cupin domain-containing protein [Chloroflexi bacterium]|nr:cupin domain-containing protein [Chloroflexota bacterium]
MMIAHAIPTRTDKEERNPTLVRKNANHASERVGQRLRSLRKARRLSIRALAEQSNLSVNTLSLIENGKTSPSVNTLSLLAQSLDVPITSFFEHEEHKRRVVYQRVGERKQIVFSQGQMEKLNEGLPHIGSEPFITRLELGANSGKTPIVFPGREFIYCLEGHITYTIEGELYPLAPGDSLIFDAYTPHTWRNTANTVSCALLVLCPEDTLEDSPERYFMPLDQTRR